MNSSLSDTEQFEPNFSASIQSDRKSGTENRKFIVMLTRQKSKRQKLEDTRKKIVIFDRTVFSISLIIFIGSTIRNFSTIFS